MGAWRTPFDGMNPPPPMPTAPFVLLRRNQQRVEAAVREGEYDAVFLSGCNLFDELVALLLATGVFAVLKLLRFKRQREGIPDELVIRVLLVSILLRCPSIRKIREFVFTDHGVLRFLGFNVRVLAEGFNKRGGPDKEKPFSHETIYDLWGEERVEEESIPEAADAYFRLLFAQGLVRGTTYVLDGTSAIAGKTKRLLVLLMNVRGGRELIAGYRLREQKEGEDPQKGELTLGRELVQAALKAGAQIRELIVDRGYIDGAWMKELVAQGVELLIRVKEDMEVFADLEGHGRAAGAQWQEREVVRRIGGRQLRYRVRVLLVRGLESWDSYQGPLTGLLIEYTPLEGKDAGKSYRMALVTPREYDDPWVMLERWGIRWRIENSGNRELKEGFLLEKGLWSDHPTAVALSVFLRVIVYNSFRLYVSKQGQGWVIRGLREMHREVLHAAGMFVIVEAGGEFGIFTIVELMHLVGKPPRLQGMHPP